jgi:DNA polymerase-3 subunit alpha
MCALLTSASGKQDDIIKYISDCRAHRIEVLPPDVNKSGFDFTIEGDRKIRFGLRAVKGIGDKAIESIIAARKEATQFTSITSFLEQVEISVVNKGVLEALIKSGAFTSIHQNRAELLASIDSMIEAARSLQKDRKSGQVSLFFGSDEASSFQIQLAKLADWPESIKLGFEKEVVGLFLSGHPLQKYEKEIRLYSSCGTISELPGKYKSMDAQCAIAGIITSQQRKTAAKSGSQFVVAAIEDLSASMEVIFFRKILGTSEALIFSEEPVIVTGKIAFDENGEPTKMIADTIKPIKEARRDAITAVHISIDPIGLDDETLENLKKIFDKHKGSCQVFFHVDFSQGKKAKVVKAHNSIRIKPSDELIEEITKLVGKDAVRYSLKGA